jgi:hypothetical protein
MTNPQFELNTEQADGGPVGAGGITDVPTPRPTPRPDFTGTCQANGDCAEGYFCDTRNPTFPTGDLTDPYGVCVKVSINYCNATDQSSPCSTILGLDWSGEATRTVNVLVNGAATPEGCINFPGIPSDWNTSECIQIPVPPTIFCNYTDQTTQCSRLPGFQGYSGEATRTVVVTNTVGQPLPLGCSNNPIFAGSDAWNTSECIGPPTPTPTSTSTPPSTYTTTLVASPPEGGTVSGTSLLTPTPSTVIVSRIGERVDFEATANIGYTFTGWELQGNSWSTNYSPAILSDKNETYVATFARNSTQDVCRCYFVAPTVAGQSFEVTFRECAAGSIRQTQTISNFTNICSADIPAAGRNAQVPQNLGSQCSNTQTCGAPPPTPTPTPVINPEVPVVTPSVTWRDCVSEELFPGTPTNRREVTYTGPGGGTCWEPLTTVTFNPSLNEELVFRYQQGSTQFPMAQVINATNASTVLSYELQIITNTDITVTPNLFIIPPRGSTPFTVQVTADLLNKLATGTSKLQMSVNIREL